jgi:hypothetical protein
MKAKDAVIKDLKSKLKKKDKVVGEKEAELESTKEDLQAKNDDLESKSMELNVVKMETSSLKKRKDKEGTLQIVKNLEIKNAKLGEQ